MLDSLRENPWPVASALTLGMLLGVTAAFAFDRRGEASADVRTVRVQRTVGTPQPGLPPARTTPPAPESPFDPPPVAIRPTEFEQALARGMERASNLGGAVDAAVWVDGWAKPLVRPASPASTRMWSLSKPATAIAVLQAKAERDPSPSEQLDKAISDAIVKSSNCGQRRVVLGLQRLLGMAGARAAVREVFQRAEARVDVSGSAERPEPICGRYLREHAAGIHDPFAPALLLGTSKWTVEDAVKFAHALGTEQYGAPGRRVLELMRERKLRSPEAVAPTDYTAPLDWGAGRELARWKPAYKGGWGGKTHPPYLASQIATFDVAGTNVAIAVTFRPSAPVSDDDPGKTVAPRAIEAVFHELAAVLTRLEKAA